MLIYFNYINNILGRHYLFYSYFIAILLRINRNLYLGYSEFIINFCRVYLYGMPKNHNSG